VGYYNGSIALGAGAVITNFNQLMVATNVTAFNMAGLADSTGTSKGTILEFDSEGNILPMAGTKLSWPLTLPLPQLMPLITFGSLPQLYQAQRMTSPLSHGEV